jgi:hypothetical protein
MRMPGDELVAQPHLLTNHAMSIEARPADVWPWLTQMGWHLGTRPNGLIGCSSRKTGRVWTTSTPLCCAASA